MDNKTTKFFTIGFLAGASFLFLLVLIPAYLNRGSEIRSIKKYGNVTITPIEVNNRILFNTGESLLIQRDQEPILTLYFDYNKNFYELSFHPNSKPLFSAFLAKDYSKWGGCSFGFNENRISYFDYTCDGIFDLYSMEKDRFIFINKAWMKVDDMEKDGTALTVDGNTTHKYVFDKEEGWGEKNTGP